MYCENVITHKYYSGINKNNAVFPHVTCSSESRFSGTSELSRRKTPVSLLMPSHCVSTYHTSSLQQYRIPVHKTLHDFNLAKR